MRILAILSWQLAAIGLACTGAAAGEPLPFSWQQSYARRTDAGGIEWTPRPFRFQHGKDIRYIDYANGADSNDGKSKDRPWKHHPWDSSATGLASSSPPADTYVFKGGVVYRGQLRIRGEGTLERPVRLTRDPAWGDGPATLAGSELVTGWRRCVDHPTIPDAGEVWMAQLSFAPRTLWMVGVDGVSTRLPLARHPNWSSQPEDHKAQWFTWTNERHPHRPKPGFTANDSKNLKGLDPEFLRGALIYSEFGWVMGTPYPTRVEDFDPADGSVSFSSWTGGGNGEVIFRGMRYYLEDKPQFLDDPNGEFWFDKQGRGGTLYVRLPNGLDPNSTRMEAGRYPSLIVGEAARNLEISGLDFRWTTPSWRLDEVQWDSRTIPYRISPSATPACIRIYGVGENIRIANCRFEDVVMGIRLSGEGENAGMRGLLVEDNVFRNVDVGAAHFSDGSVWGVDRPMGVLEDVRLYRNAAFHVGFRAPRYERGCAFDFGNLVRGEIAGNVIERSGAQAINVVGGKGAMRGDVPLIRILIHQNKAWKTMQNANDFGGIESWQHGTVYIFNNLSFDARGQWEAQRIFHKESPGFGHAYYLDGGFKHYLFNNIAWGLSRDPASPLVNCAAFQEILSFQNVFLNNTAYNFYVGSRRQAPHAGRNQYVGNVWQGIHEHVFRHSDPADTAADGNARDAGPQKESFAFETNVYARNVFHDYGKMGVFEPSGRWHFTFKDFQSALAERKSRVSELGVEDSKPPLQNPAQGDFRLAANSSGVDRGGVTFVPWAVYGVVGEWNFYPAGNSTGTIPDEHWRANDYLADRKDYDKRPTFPLTVVNGEPSDYVSGPLENFTLGALQFSPERGSYATASDADLNRPYVTELPTRPQHRQDAGMQSFTFEGEALKSPEIHTGNFLIEAVFRADADGLLVEKLDGSGYSLRIENGRIEFRVSGEDGSKAAVQSDKPVANGKWHHVLVEADRERRTLAIYLDGKRDVTGDGIARASLANAGDLFVGGRPGQKSLGGAIDMVRIAHGTLEDSKTSIEELYAWQFDGPFLRDLRGNPVLGRARDAGAIESH